MFRLGSRDRVYGIRWRQALELWRTRVVSHPASLYDSPHRTCDLIGLSLATVKRGFCFALAILRDLLSSLKCCQDTPSIKHAVKRPAADPVSMARLSARPRAGSSGPPCRTRMNPRILSTWRA